MIFSNWFPFRRRRHEISPTRSRRFSCSSFKDIQYLLYDDDPSPEPYSPRLQVLHQKRSPKIDGCAVPQTNKTPFPNTDHGGVVLYYTSLRIVRKTFEECRTVRSILHRLRIPIDERDLSMDSRFQDELETIFGKKKKVVLPKVFIGGRYIGGAEEIKQLEENDELRKMIGELPPSDGKICDLCRGWRFVVCERCNGSHKIFSEKYDGFTSCIACDVQGLVRCSSCFPMHRRGRSDISAGLKIKN